MCVFLSIHTGRAEVQAGTVPWRRAEANPENKPDAGRSGSSALHRQELVGLGTVRQSAKSV